MGGGLKYQKRIKTQLSTDPVGAKGEKNGGYNFMMDLGSNGSKSSGNERILLRNHAKCILP